jgi:replicative DNA helicase
MITFAGDANVGKTGFMFELALRLAKLNENIMVLFMSIDDSRQQAIARLVALESGLRINQVSHPLQNIHTDEERITLESGWRSIRKLVEENKFSIKDNTHGNTLDFAEGWIRWAKENYPDREIAFFLDNFHKLGDERSQDERIRFKHASARIHAMKNKLHFTAICTMEIRKFVGGASQRPVLQDISESKQMEYDNNLIGMVYSDLHAKRQEAKVFWTELIDGVSVDKPVIEIDIQKNKISEFKGELYYKFSPEHSKFMESTGQEVADWKREYQSALQHVMDKKFPDGGENPFISGKTASSF